MGKHTVYIFPVIIFGLIYSTVCSGSFHDELLLNPVRKKEIYQLNVYNKNPFTDKAAPVAPTNLEVFDLSFDYVLLMWDDNSDNETFYFIERHLEGEEFSRFDTLGANETLYLDYRVDPNTTYFYRVLAINADGESGYSNEVSATTFSLPHTPPLPPTDLSGHFDGINANILSWTDNSYNEISFHIYRGTALNNLSLFDTVVYDRTLYADYSVASNTSYFYYLTSWNEFGESTHTDTIQVDVGNITGIDAPELSLVHTTYNSITLQWNTITGNHVTYSLSRFHEGDSIEEFDVQSVTEYIDSGLVSSDMYSYLLEAIDEYGNHAFSDTVKAFTLPEYSRHRVTDSLIALFIFSQLRNDTLPDQSWYNEPVILSLSDSSQIIGSYYDHLAINNNDIISSSSYSAEKISDACMQSNELTLECWLKTSQVIDPGVPTQIMALETDSSTAFSLSCISSPEFEGKIRYLVNLTTVTTDQLGKPDFSSELTADMGVLQHVVFTHDRSGNESLYINGTKAAEEFRPPKFNNWLPPYQLVFANNTSGNEPWLGSLYMSAIYNRALSPDEIMKNYLASPFISDSVILNSADYVIFIYPNPVSETVFLQIDSEQRYTDVTEEYLVRIINASGTILMEQAVSYYLDNYSEIEFDISTLKQGVYSIVLYNQHRFIDCKKIIIIR